jgi:hypothetical protein
MYFKKGSKTVGIDQSFGIDDNGVLHVGSLPSSVEGMNYPAGALRRMSPQERAELGFEELAQPPVVDGRFFLDANTPRPIDQVRKDLASQVAAVRYQKEQAGVTINGVHIATDDRSQVKLIGVRIRASANPSYTVNWKTSEGFVLLNAATIITISDTVADHVQACFDAEAQHAADIAELADVEAAMAYDINAGWPT